MRKKYKCTVCKKKFNLSALVDIHGLVACRHCHAKRNPATVPKPILDRIEEDLDETK